MLDPGLRVHRADLDGAEVRVRADVVPEVGVVLDHARVDHEADPLLVVVPVRRRRAACPTRGNARKIGIRVEARPVASPRQNGELADSASSTGTCTRIPLATWIALSASSMPDVHVQAEDDLLARDEAQRLDQVAVARRGRRSAGPPTARTGACRPSRSQVAAARRPRRPGGAAPRSSRAGLARVVAGGVAISSTDSMQLGLDVPVAVAAASSSSASIALASSQLPRSRIISSSSMPSV